MKFISPIFIDIPRKTKKPRRIYLNLNVYRNLNPFINGQAKIIYTEQMLKSMKGNRIDRKFNMVFKLFKKSNRGDSSNTYCIVEKFFCDALIHHGVIKNDDDSFIGWKRYEESGVDKINPRCEIEIITQ